MLFQRARANEFTCGDQNKKFFHRKAEGRHKRNRLVKLIDDDGVETNKFKCMGDIAMKYFQSLFESDVKVFPEAASQGIQPFVSSEDNQELSRPFTVEEDLRPISLCNVLYKIMSSLDK